MWLFSRKRHLKYSSIRAWIEGERIPIPVTSVQDEKPRNQYLEQHAELRRHLFDEHLKSLAPNERDLLARGKHPSQSHSRAKKAEPYARQLFDSLKHLDCIKAVGPGAYHMDRLVLNVSVSRQPTAKELAEIPDFFGGFEVKGPIVVDDSLAQK
jgi:hypothetical protein